MKAKKIIYAVIALAVAAFTFTSCEDVPEPYNIPVSGNGGTSGDDNAKGGVNNPYTIEEAIAAIKDGTAPTTEVHVKGIVSSVEYYNETYKSLSYWLSDDGKTNALQVYSGKGLNGADFSSKDESLVGKTVVVKGVLKYFEDKGIYEVDKGSTIISISDGSGTSGNDNVKGGVNNPYTIEEAIAAIKDGTAPTTEVHVKGIVSSVEYYNETYKSLSYWLSDDGKTNALQVYSGKGLNGADFSSKDESLVGKTVVVKGVLKYFEDKNIYEVDKGSTIISISDGGGGTGGGEGSDTDKGGVKNPYTIAEAIAAIKDGTAPTTEVHVKGIVSSVEYYNETYKSLSYWLSDDGKTNALQVYSGKGLNGADFSSKDESLVGKTVVVKGVLKYFKDKNIYEVDKGSTIISIDGGGGTGGGEVTPPTPDGEKATMTKANNIVTFVNEKANASANTIECDFTTFGWTDKTAPGIATLSDGTTITFGKGENERNAPTFYAATKGVRVYANNTITIKANKAIAKVVATCDTYNNTIYVGNDEMYASIANNEWTIVNKFTGSGGGVQFRVQKIVITYAK